MSLVTRCTACGTLFKVVADQLKISDGWVRCGQCGTVFDAQSNLVDPLATTPVASSKQPATSLPPVSSTSASASWSSVEPSTSDDNIGSESNSVFQPGKLREAALLDSDIGPSTASWVDSSAPEDAEAPNETAPYASTEPARTPTFIKQARAAQRWRSPWVRLALGLASLVLMCALAAQIVGHEKDRIAAQLPQAKPLLERYCLAMKCEIRPYRRMDAITVDASSFNRINKNNPQLEASAQSYRLSVQLKNSATYAVAVPHIELSLQDAQDQLMLRRVVTPAELGIALQELGPGQDTPGSAVVQVSTGAIAGNRVQGYRVLAFYP